MRFSAHGFIFCHRMNTRFSRIQIFKDQLSQCCHPCKSSGQILIASYEDARVECRKRTAIRRTLPNSKKVYVSGKLHHEIKVPFREISLAPTKTMNGEIEINEPVRVYDTSGPWGDPDFHGDVTQGLPPLRAKWIRERGDVETIAGREVTPLDDGYLSQMHAEHAQRRNGSSKSQVPNSRETSNLEHQTSKFAPRRPLRAQSGRPVTQLYYARQGIITPEMEFIAIRENLGREILGSAGASPAPFGASPNGSNRAQRSALPPCRLRTNRQLAIGNWKSDHSRIRPLRSRARPRHHSRKHQSSRIRADDHRP